MSLCFLLFLSEPLFLGATLCHILSANNEKLFKYFKRLIQAIIIPEHVVLTKEIYSTKIVAAPLFL
jgi:hypothetical protein